MKDWLNSLPPALRSAVLGLGSVLVFTAATGFSGVESWDDVKLKAGALGVALIQAASRWALDVMTAKDA
jgi:hypothetical protein